MHSATSALECGKTHAGYRSCVRAGRTRGRAGRSGARPPAPRPTHDEPAHPATDVAHEDNLERDHPESHQSAEEYRNYLTKFRRGGALCRPGAASHPAAGKEVATGGNWGYLAPYSLPSRRWSAVCSLLCSGWREPGRRALGDVVLGDRGAATGQRPMQRLAVAAGHRATNQPAVVETRAVAACEVAAATFGASATSRRRWGWPIWRATPPTTRRPDS